MKLWMVLGVFVFTNPAFSWDFTGITWEVQGPTVVATPESREFGWASTPRSREVTVSARITIRETHGDDWKIAGVAIGDGARSFWHWALVQAPGSGRRYVELAEMRDGNWNAQNDDALPLIESQGSGWRWEDNQGYRLTLCLDGKTVSGTVTTEAGDVVVRITRGLNETSVHEGRPGLVDGGFRAEWTEVITTTGGIPSPLCRLRSILRCTPQGSSQ